MAGDVFCHVCYYKLSLETHRGNDTWVRTNLCYHLQLSLTTSFLHGGVHVQTPISQQLQEHIEINTLPRPLHQTRYTPAAIPSPVARYEKTYCTVKQNNGCHWKEQPAGSDEKQQQPQKQWTHHHIERMRSHAGHWWWPMLPFVIWTDGWVQITRSSMSPPLLPHLGKDVN